MKLTSEQIDNILALNAKNVMSKDIATQVNLPLKAIRGCLKNSKRQSINSRNFFNVQVKHDYFDKIDTPEKAYLVGLLAADGNINKHSLRLRIHPKDKELVEFMCKELNWLKQPTITKNGVNSTSVNISIRSLKLVSALIKNHNFNYNKTYVNLFKDMGDLTRFFLLGLFDGDGSIFHSAFNRKSGKYQGKREELYRFSYTGNTSTANSIVDYLVTKGIELKVYSLKKNVKVSYVHTTKKQALIDLRQYLYDGHDLGLKRKRYMFDKAVKFYTERCSTTIISDSSEMENMV